MHEHDFRHFAIPRALASFAQLDHDLLDRSANPFVQYFTDHAIGRLLVEPPRAVGITISYVSQLVPALTLARLIREHLGATAIVLGGAYLTAIADQIGGLPAAVAGVDAIVLHDGEEALDGWLTGVLRDRGDMRDLANLFLPEEGTYRRVRPGPWEQTDLDGPPSPLWIADGLDLSQRKLAANQPAGPAPNRTFLLWRNADISTLR